MCQPPTAAQVSAPPPTTTTGEKTGRWTDEEHTRFLHGLELFGKKWTKVADVVGSRTTVQVRSHAQKYFQKLEKDRAQPSGGGGPGPRGAGPAGASSATMRVRRGPHPAVPLALRKFLPAGTGQNGHAGPADVAAASSIPEPLALPSKPDKVKVARTILTVKPRTCTTSSWGAVAAGAAGPCPSGIARGGRLDERCGTRPRSSGRTIRRGARGPAAALPGTTAEPRGGRRRSGRSRRANDEGTKRPWRTSRRELNEARRHCRAFLR